MTVTMTIAAETPRLAERNSRGDKSVLMVAPSFPPIAGAGVFRTMRFVNYLPEFGWRPLVLSVDPGEGGDPSLLHMLPDELYVRRVPRHVNGDGASAEASGTASGPAGDSPPSLIERCKNTAAYRALRHAWKLVTETPDKHVKWNKVALPTAVQIIHSERPQAIYTSGPPHSVHLLGRYLKLRTGVPWIADFRDPWARRPWGIKPENPWGQRLYPWFESRCIYAADRVILNTESMRQDFVNAYPGLPEDHFVAITNACDPALAETVSQLLSQQSRRAEGDPIRLCHPGSLYRERDPRPLIHAVAALQERGINVRFDQIGHCDSRFALEELSKQLHIEASVHVTPPIPHKEVLERMAASDVLVLLQPRTPIQVPGKLFEMILFGKPILALCDEGATAELVRDYELGEVADPDSPDAIDAALQRIITGLRSRTSSNGHDNPARSAFDARSLTGVLADTFESAVGSAQP